MSVMSISHQKKKILEVKRIINCILENGAYSLKNEQNQMVKKGDSYNPQEKVLVRMSWKYRRYLGKQAQQSLLDLYERDKDFLDFVKSEDKELHEMFKGMIELNERINS